MRSLNQQQRSVKYTVYVFGEKKIVLPFFLFDIYYKPKKYLFHSYLKSFGLENVYERQNSLVELVTCPFLIMSKINLILQRYLVKNM